MLIKNVDKEAYKLAKMLSVKEEKPVGQVISEAIGVLLEKKKEKKRGFQHLPVFDLGPSSENLSQEIDDILYGGRR